MFSITPIYFKLENMKIVKDLIDIPPCPGPLGFTLGSFDGVHLGHQYLLNQLRHKVGNQGTVAVLTFTRSPAEILKKRVSSLPLCDLKEKLIRLEQARVDLLILLEFTEELATCSYQDFINNIRKHYPFTHLILGKGAAFGKDRLGNEDNIHALGQEMGFTAEYIQKKTIDGSPISSRRIRSLLAEGKTEEANRLLGKKPSLC
jgi:riboflavin kinase/FMN adenylyltransferase